MKKRIKQEAAVLLAGADLIATMTEFCKECEDREDLGIAIAAIRQYVEKGFIDEAYIDRLDELYDLRKKQ